MLVYENVVNSLEKNNAGERGRACWQEGKSSFTVFQNVVWPGLISLGRRHLAKELKLVKGEAGECLGNERAMLRKWQGHTP